MSTCLSTTAFEESCRDESIELLLSSITTCRFSRLKGLTAELELLPSLYGELKTLFKSKLFLDIELLSYVVETVTFEAIILLVFKEPVDNISQF